MFIFMATHTAVLSSYKFICQNRWNLLNCVRSHNIHNHGRISIVLRYCRAKMIKLFSLKQQKKDEEGSGRPGGGSQKKATAAQLRITKVSTSFAQYDAGVLRSGVWCFKRQLAGVGCEGVCYLPTATNFTADAGQLTFEAPITVLRTTASCRAKLAETERLRTPDYDLNELNLPKTCSTEFPDPDDLLNFKLIICPDEGFYRGGRFVFSFKVGPNYPHEPPKVKCETAVYHPNIDLEGNVCLNILREDWKPVLTVNSIVYGLQYLFLEPNPEDPLNKMAAEDLQSNRRLFEQHVQRAMRGGYVGTSYFTRCLK